MSTSKPKPLGRARAVDRYVIWPLGDVVGHVDVPALARDFLVNDTSLGWGPSCSGSGFWAMVADHARDDFALAWALSRMGVTPAGHDLAGDEEEDGTFTVRLADAGATEQVLPAVVTLSEDMVPLAASWRTELVRDADGYQCPFRVGGSALVVFGPDGAVARDLHVDTDGNTPSGESASLVASDMLASVQEEP